MMTANPGVYRFRIWTAVLCLAAACFAQQQGQAPTSAQPKGITAATEKDRGQVLAELGSAQKAFAGKKGDSEARFRLARLLFQAGYFQKAETCVGPLADSANPTKDALFLAADVQYLMGRYEKAEALLNRVMALNPSDIPSFAKAQTKLAFVYYQTNQYAKSAGLFKGLEGKIRLPLWDLMKSFGADQPLVIDWPENLKQTILPFLVTDPLPIISVELQGRQVYALIDTGADTFVLDNEVAASLGLKPVTAMQGTFAGGKQAEVGFGRAESLKLGDVALRQVPISILPTTQFSRGFAEGRYTISAILGTGILKQFLSTLDYPHARLVLRRAGAGGLDDMRREWKGRKTVEIPFVLALSHLMLASGRLNEKDGLVFFVDSGLASQAAFGAPAETLKYAGIPIPETKVHEGDIGGGGGGGFATGEFPIQKLGLGPLVQDHKTGDYGSVPPGSYWRLGFITDGLISHQFLRRYAWTIDFSRMTMIFVL